MKKLIAMIAIFAMFIGGAMAQNKKDGTPDMRYKNNKGTHVVATQGKTKKDGTLDKRYKQNKTSSATTVKPNKPMKAAPTKKAA